MAGFFRTTHIRNVVQIGLIRIVTLSWLIEDSKTKAKKNCIFIDIVDFVTKPFCLYKVSGFNLDIHNVKAKGIIVKYHTII